MQTIKSSIGASANAYDSMADYYEGQGDLSNAVQYVTNANN